MFMWPHFLYKCTVTSQNHVNQASKPQNYKSFDLFLKFIFSEHKEIGGTQKYEVYFTK